MKKTELYKKAIEVHLEYDKHYKDLIEQREVYEIKFKHVKELLEELQAWQTIARLNGVTNIQPIKDLNKQNAEAKKEQTEGRNPIPGGVDKSKARLLAPIKQPHPLNEEDV